ncbi:23S rRNA pseudouridine2605 synthase [Salinimicrobium sediminis]|uniref:23S rRNA pseudouridine2605 synthase n=1 Tax=Salinimicrobium sediminis TaxID=1343891 RepID=A0A285X3M1_9FLAO|nr:pseudouridine synthase [Salinimicrobium sediminis]SOC79943.1 23S rRNA pseudouridine2605 synthase [Salinimicrobium sediminis]
MSRNDRSSGSRGDRSSGKSSGRQGGGERSKSHARGNTPVNRNEKDPKTMSRGNAPVKKKTGEKSEGIRLNKFVANSGVCSRRDADIYIAAGNVTVNGKVITEMGYKVLLKDEVKFDGRRILPEKPEYVLLNKPKGFFVTGSLEKKNRTVMDLIANASKSKLDPVGKLDTQATGLILFTNDGVLAKSLANPKNGIRQIYHLELDKDLAYEDLQKIKEGVNLEDGTARVTEVSYVENKPKREVGLELRSTKPHIVQRIFKSLGYEIQKLDRVVYGGLTKKDLGRGHWRVLNKQEIINLSNL